jgi:predicted ATPase
VLRRLRLKNFKAWKDTGSLELAPLTVLFGANSSGKSSINHLLMLLRQTVRSPDRKSVLDLGDPESPVQLGSFRDFIFDHRTKESLGVEFDWDLPSSLIVRDPISRERWVGDVLAFQGSVRQAASGRTLQSEGFSYQLKQNAGEKLKIEFLRDAKRTDRWQIRSSPYDLVRTKGRPWELPKPVHFYGFPNEASVYFQNSAFLGDLELAFEGLLEGLSYLGPIRQPPARIYPWAGTIPEDVGWRGENAVNALLAGSDRRFNWTAKARTKSLEEIVAGWLKRLGLITSFEVSEIAPDRSEYEVRVRARQRSAEVKLTDVGFGVSQVLPVVTQVFYAPPKSTVLMEQPEIHLHPRAQSVLGDLLIEAVTAREGSAERGIQMIVESHSEHLLRRIQRRIAEEKIDPSQIALYFCYSGPNGSAMDRLEVDSFGDILNWPPDFFGDELEDVATQADVGMQRRLRIREARNSR